MYDSDFWVQDSAVTAKCNEWRSLTQGFLCNMPVTGLSFPYGYGHNFVNAGEVCTLVLFHFSRY